MRNLIAVSTAIAVVFLSSPSIAMGVKPNRFERTYCDNTYTAKGVRSCEKQSERSNAGRARPCSFNADRLPVILINGPGTPGHEGEGEGKPDKPEKPSTPDKPSNPGKDKPSPSKDKPSKSDPC